MIQRLPTVSENLISAVAGGNHIDLRAALQRLADENVQLIMLGDIWEGTPLTAIAAAYELLHRQADANWTEENCG